MVFNLKNHISKAIAAGAVIIGTILGGAGIAMAATTIYVDDTGCSAGGPGTQAQPFCTIQQGVDAATAGDTIRVQAGNYNDPVNVNKSLTLIGSQAVVNTGGVDGMTLSADNITVRGFTFSGNSAGPGLMTSKDFSGYTITRNTFTNNVFGIYLNSSGAIASTVSHNTFDNNNLAGAVGGNGIYADQGASNVAVDHNVFKNQDNAAMIFVSTADAITNDNLQIHHNTFNGPGSFLILVNGHNDTFDHNAGTGFNNLASAIFLGGSDGSVRIDHNSLVGTAGSSSGVRINVDEANYGTGETLTLVANTNITVDHNSIRNFGDAGISVGNSDNTTVTMTGSTIDHNSVNNNGNGEADFDGGILIRAGNTGNNINHNSMHGNNPFDAEDDNTSGGGTLNTGNTWSKNSCTTGSPAGLCSA